MKLKQEQTFSVERILIKNEALKMYLRIEGGGVGCGWEKLKVFYQFPENNSPPPNDQYICHSRNRQTYDAIPKDLGRYW